MFKRTIYILLLAALDKFVNILLHEQMKASLLCLSANQVFYRPMGTRWVMWRICQLPLFPGPISGTQFMSTLAIAAEPASPLNPTHTALYNICCGLFSIKVEVMAGHILPDDPGKPPGQDKGTVWGIPIEKLQWSCGLHMGE